MKKCIQDSKARVDSSTRSVETDVISRLFVSVIARKEIIKLIAEYTCSRLAYAWLETQWRLTRNTSTKINSSALPAGLACVLISGRVVVVAGYSLLDGIVDADTISTLAGIVAA
jgi:hypothetical protein